MAREDLHFRLRLPEALKTRIEEAAAKRQRSMTAEIVDRLDFSFDRAKQQREENLQLIHGLGLDNNELRAELERLKIENGRLRAALDESRASNFALQHLLENDRGEPGGDTVSNTPMTPELFHQLFGDMRDRLDRIERKVDRRDDPEAKK